MKKIGFIVFLSALIIGSILAAKSGFSSLNIIKFGKSARGSGTAKTETRDVSGFEGIQASGAVNVEITVQKEFSVQVEADDNLLQNIKTEISGDNLKIYSEGSISPKTRINIKVSMPELHSLELSGASDVIVSNVKSDSLKLEASGASKIKVDGEATNLESEASGASAIDAEGLKVEIAEVEANGASKTIVFAVNELKADASGASTIYYTGDPKEVISKNSGASSVKRK